MAVFGVSNKQDCFVIYERHNDKNRLAVSYGELTETEMRAIAYRILAMVESDRVH